jgi:hypothetical protein
LLAGLVGLVGGTATTWADSLNLASISCSDGSQFNVSVDTDTLTKLTNTITGLNTAGAPDLSCSLALLPSDPTTTTTADPVPGFAVGGGFTSTTKFAFSAHLHSNGSLNGYAVVDTTISDPTGYRAKGHVSCYNNFGGITRFAVVGFTVDSSSGLTAPASGTEIDFQVQDSGNASSPVADMWGLDQASTNCDAFRGFVPATDDVVSGNIVARP